MAATESPSLTDHNNRLATALSAPARRRTQRRRASPPPRPQPAGHREAADGKAPPKRMKRQEYEKELKKLQGELVKLQLWAKHTGARVVVLFEGRDAAGKGGVIKAITERTSPRSFRIAALPAP